MREETRAALFGYFVGFIVGIAICLVPIIRLICTDGDAIISMNDVVKVEATETGVYLTMENGTGYYWEGDVELPTTIDLNTDQGYEAACNFMDQILDWNTDGEELSVVTIDGYELYTYKDEDVD